VQIAQVKIKSEKRKLRKKKIKSKMRKRKFFQNFLKAQAQIAQRLKKIDKAQIE